MASTAASSFVARASGAAQNVILQRVCARSSGFASQVATMLCLAERALYRADWYLEADHLHLSQSLACSPVPGAFHSREANNLCPDRYFGKRGIEQDPSRSLQRFSAFSSGRTTKRLVASGHCQILGIP